ncbi:uncharacterized protein BXZ73DRAFT_61980, partial [Epithele typhae]|uniref:uncharacterized protein n=1 Tax=Epithele typhae TaxID=378194 RepID=UPI002007F3C7
FFARYPDFKYQKGASLPLEFRRLGEESDWKKQQEKEAKRHLRDAMVKQFNTTYGRDASNLASWQLLCSMISDEPPPNTVNKCRKIIDSTHVNLVDFIDGLPGPFKVRTFPSVGDLAKYTHANEKYFPKENAHAGSLLKQLLRKIGRRQ